MDGIVAIQQPQQHSAPSSSSSTAAAAVAAARRKEWRVVSEGGGGQQQQQQRRLFEAAAPSARMSHPQVRQRFPGSASRQRNGRVYQSDPDNVNSEKITAKSEGEQMDCGDQALEPADAHMDDLQHRLSEISRQRDHLQQVELDLKVRFFARNEILRLQANFDEQAKQHSDIVNGLQDQLRQRDEAMQELQQHAEERERQLQMEANEARNQLWAKEAFIRDQTNELATLRRDRDNALAENKSNAAQIDAERAEHHAEVDILKEQIHEKERRLQELEEQLRDAQLWMARSQELEAYHMNAMHAELRERTEQMTQLWVSCQRQVSDVERYYQQVIQKLQQDIDTNHFVRNKEMTMDGAVIRVSKAVDQGMALHHKPPIMHMEAAIPIMMPPDGLPTIEHATGLPVLSAPILGMTSVVPPSPTIPQYNPIQSTMQFPPPVPPVLVPQRTPMKQQQGPVYHPAQVIQRQQRPIEHKHTHNSSEESNTQLTGNDVAKPSIEQERSSMDKIFSGLTSQKHPYMDRHQSEEAAPETTSAPKQQANHSGGFNSVIERSKAPGHVNNKTDQSTLDNGQQVEKRGLEQNHVSSHEELREEAPVPVSANGNDANGSISDMHLMDRDSLLACLIRVIPAEASAKIRISTTLPNRLAKVLAPLHWHDYRKHYGRLDEFVDAHSQLFVVEGDYIYLREGAQAIVSASTAAAKAAATVPSSRTVQAPTVALTPVAVQGQSQRSRGNKNHQNSETTTTTSTSPQEKRRDPTPAPPANGNYGGKNVNFTGDAGSFKENGHSYGNGVLDGYASYNGSAYYKNRGQEIGSRPQTQEGRILETA